MSRSDHGVCVLGGGDLRVHPKYCQLIGPFIFWGRLPVEDIIIKYTGPGTVACT